MKTNPHPITLLGFVGVGAIAVSIACFFVAGAEPKAPPAVAKAPSTDETRQLEHAKAQRRLALLRMEFDNLNDDVQKKLRELYKMREELGLTDREIDESASNALGVDSQRILETQILETTMKRRELESLHQELRKMTRPDLKSALPTASPDPALISLLQNEAAAEQKLVALSVSHAQDHPDVRAAQGVLNTIRRGIDERLEGIMRGMAARITASQATLEHLSKELEQTKAASIERAITIGPYFQSKRDLESLQQIRDRLHQRLIQDRVDLVLSEVR